MENWIEYIDLKFSEYEKINSHENKNGFYPSRIYKINGTYIEFEFDGITKLKKIECGKYWTINNAEYISKVKAVFEQSKNNFILFLQTSFDGENETKYELKFTPENIKKLDRFLKLPIETGWIEKLYKYKNGAYKIEIENLSNEFEINNCEIILLDIAEQDLPFVGDKLSRKINTFFIDKFAKKENIEVEITEIKPIEDKKTNA
ncbi:hypothetical protein [Flavobacterium croceum]|uniref:hypothetical protein n=1 Tax=Flavobacterium croceum TaxID=370975 RepID=UPI0024A7EBE5|nr:hypothetical protein [Flavobacterium croceum]